MGIKDNNVEKKGFVGKDSNTYYTKNLTTISWTWSSDNMLWFAGETLFRADKIWWGKFGAEILKEGGLSAPLGKDVTTVIGPVSFFYDKCPDLVYAFFCDTGYPLDSTRHLTGLTYAMNEARKAFLFDWAQKLVETIMKMKDAKEFEFLGKYRHLEDQWRSFPGDFLESPDMTLKRIRLTYAREALEWMARVLAFIETSPENAVKNGIGTFLEYNDYSYKNDNSIVISKALREIDHSLDKTKIWKPFLGNTETKGANFQRSRARLSYIREFLEESTLTINSALDVRGFVNIKGSKSAILK
ncbi:MAG: hypothetical protein JRC68_09930, partial [Deltaproteobacteria bacterium]|nr:hypothetical protein [Deltaproteobacteria bacterium]